MNQIKIYILAFFDVAWIVGFLLSDIDSQLRSLGLIVGLVVALVTLYKLFLDISIKRIDKQLRDLERKNKLRDWEERIKKDLE